MRVNQCSHLYKLHVWNYWSDPNKALPSTPCSTYFICGFVLVFFFNKKTNYLWGFWSFVSKTRKCYMLPGFTQHMWLANSPCCLTLASFHANSASSHTHTDTTCTAAQTHPQNHGVVERTVTFALKLSSHQVSIWWEHAEWQLDDWFLGQTQAFRLDNSKVRGF